MKSSFKNMVLSLGGITIVAALLIGCVNEVTKKPIAEASLKTQTEAMNTVMPKHDNDPLKDKVVLTVDGQEATVYPALLNGKVVGAAVEASADGFSGKIAVVYGFEADGTVINYSVLSHSETPGLGSKMQDWFRDAQGKRSVVGCNPGKENMTVSKDGGTVDAITAATISSRAFLKTLNGAFKAYMEYSNKAKH